MLYAYMKFAALFSFPMDEFQICFKVDTEEYFLLRVYIPFVHHYISSLSLPRTYEYIA
jgi:hypothetical protein